MPERDEVDRIMTQRFVKSFRLTEGTAAFLARNLRDVLAEAGYTIERSTSSLLEEEHPNAS